MSDLISREDAYAAIRGLTRHIDRIAAITALPAVSAKHDFAQPGLETALRATLLDLITEQSEGEWDDKTINTDVEVFLASILTVINKGQFSATPNA